MELHTTTDAGTCRVALEGTFTFNDNLAFRDAVLSRIDDAACREIALDLTGVEFIDSAALGMLLLAHDKAKAVKMPLTLHGVQGNVRRIFDMARFEQFFVY